jgi:hypothetical protein
MMDWLSGYGSPQQRIKVAYIGGLGRSGSTLLDRILGQLPGFFSVGEARDLWQRGLRENRLCGCGAPFRECPFWTDVGSAAFGGWNSLDLDEVQGLAGMVDRHAAIPFLILPAIRPHFRRRLVSYTALLSRLFGAIHEVGQTRVIIDSSKAPSTAFVMRKVPDLDLRAVHLIRDSRGVAYSWTKQVLRPDVTGPVEYMHRYAPARMGARWVIRNMQMEVLGRLSVPRVLVRYERLVESPREQIVRVLESLGENADPGDLSFITDGVVELGLNHTVMGNPMRMQTGPLALRIDEQWKSAMPHKECRTVTVLTAPWLRRYGYRP